MVRSYAERQADKKSDLSGSGGGPPIWKPSKGQNNLIVFPAVAAWKDKKGKKHPAIDICERKGVHWDAPNGEAVNCPKESDGEDCYLCEQFFKAKDGNIKDEAERDQILETCKLQTHFLYNVVDLDDTDSGVQLFRAAFTIHDEIINALLDEEEFDLESEESHWNSLRTFKFRNTGKGAQRYKSFKLGKAGSVPKKYSRKKIRRKLHDLKAEATKWIPTYKETKKAFKGISLKKDNDEDGDALGGRKKKGKKKKGKKNKSKKTKKKGKK